MKRDKNLETILIITLGFILIYLKFESKWILLAGFVIGVLGIISNPIAGFITKYWYKLAKFLGNIMSKILLSLVFFIFLYPISIINSLFSKDILQLKKSKENSYFHTRNYTYKPEDFDNVW